MCNNDAIALGVLASLKNVGYGTAEKPFPVITGMDAILQTSRRSSPEKSP